MRSGGGGDQNVALSVQVALHRCLEQGPLPFAITRGPTHALLYANAAFWRLASLSDEGGIALPIANAFTESRREALTAILDRAFLGAAERLDDRLDDGRDDGNGWKCSVWSVVAPDGKTEGLGIELREARHPDGALDLQRQIAEQMLLGALRERGFAEEAEKASENRRVLLVQAEGARAEANAANLAKVSFLANMSHDLRTPLNAILGYADLLEVHVHGPLTADQENDVARIKRSARYLTSLINDILNFAKIEAGTLDLRLAVVSVSAMINWLEEVLHPQLDARGLTFSRSDCSGFVRADPDKLRQVLLNLTANAMKFTPAGGISIHCRRTKSIVSIEITDTGVGIPQDQFERIFEPFIQVNRSLTQVNNDGVGLGLAISRHLARAMGGDISVRSTLDRGSVFALALPRATEPQ
ncbi:MAG: ATP-binding protein [Gemmatimonadaceae bacterium]